MEPTTVAGVLLAQLLANHALLEELAKKASEKAAEKLGDHLGEKLSKLGQPLLSQAQKDAQFKDALLALARDRQNVTKQSALRALVISLLASNPLLAGELADLLEIPPWFPPRKADRFFGRADLIGVLTGHLQARRSVTLQGAGGLGKTALASECLRRVAPGPDQPGPFPTGVFSHDYYAKPDHASALMGLLAQGKQDNVPEAAHSTRVRELLDRPGVLLYLEGCEKATQLNQLIELSGQATILFTTRDKDQCGQSEIINLQPLDSRSGAHVLVFHAHLASPPSDDAQWQPWEALAARLGGHPLALRLCGTWLQKRGQGPQEFLARLDRSGFAFWDTSKAEKENLRVLFQHSAEAALGKHSRALEAWFALALHGHAPVPLPPLQAALGCDADELTDALGALADYSLAERGEFPSEQIGQAEPAWQLTHALLGEWGRDHLGSSRREEAQTHSGMEDGASSPRLLPKRDDQIYRAWRAWWRQDLNRCWNYCAVPGGPVRYAALQPHWNSLLEVIRKLEFEGGCELSAEQNFIACSHQEMGCYSLALPLHERSLEVRKSKLGGEHPDTLASLNNLAILLDLKGDLAEAELLYLRAVEAQERSLGLGHPNTLGSLNNLAILLAKKGDLSGAELLYSRATQAMERTQGPEHANTLSCLNNLANLLREKEDWAGADLIYRRVLATRERTQGHDHPDTLASLMNLASLLAENENWTEAEPLFERVLAARKRILGAKHPEYLSSLNNHANLLADKGDLVGAERLYRSTLAARERSLGLEHPDTLVSLINLAILLRTNGDLAGAEPLAERAAQGLLTKLGTEHPHTLKAQRLLAKIREKMAKGGQE